MNDPAIGIENHLITEHRRDFELGWGAAVPSPPVSEAIMILQCLTNRKQSQTALSVSKVVVSMCGVFSDALPLGACLRMDGFRTTGGLFGLHIYRVF